MSEKKIPAELIRSYLCGYHFTNKYVIPNKNVRPCVQSGNCFNINSSIQQTVSTAFAMLAIPALREFYSTSCKRSLQRNLEMLSEPGGSRETAGTKDPRGLLGEIRAPLWHLRVHYVRDPEVKG